MRTHVKYVEVDETRRESIEAVDWSLHDDHPVLTRCLDPTVPQRPDIPSYTLLVVCMGCLKAEVGPVVMIASLAKRRDK
jgi:hypothetical protein